MEPWQSGASSSSHFPANECVVRLQFARQRGAAAWHSWTKTPLLSSVSMFNVVMKVGGGGFVQLPRLYDLMAFRALFGKDVEGFISRKQRAPVQCDIHSEVSAGRKPQLQRSPQVPTCFSLRTRTRVSMTVTHLLCPCRSILTTVAQMTTCGTTLVFALPLCCHLQHAKQASCMCASV